MDHDDEHARVLAALRKVAEESDERSGFAADEVGAAADMDPTQVEAILDELVETGRVEVVTAYWPDQGGAELPPGGRLYHLADADLGDVPHD